MRQKLLPLFFVIFLFSFCFVLVDATQGAIPFLDGCYDPPPQAENKKNRGLRTHFKVGGGVPWLFRRLLRFLGSAAGRPSLRR